MKIEIQQDFIEPFGYLGFGRGVGGGVRKRYSYLIFNFCSWLFVVFLKHRRGYTYHPF